MCQAIFASLYLGVGLIVDLKSLGLSWKRQMNDYNMGSNSYSNNQD